MSKQQKQAVIIGASGGIGSALTESLSQSGWSLVLAGRDQRKIELSAHELGSCVQGIESIEASDFEQVDLLIKNYPGTTALVNLAGSILLKPAQSTSAQEFQETISQNLTSAFSCVRAAGKHMRMDGGSVVLMSSCAAQVGLSNHEAISAAKAGVEGLVRSAAASYAGNNLRFNAVAPGLVDTPLASGILSSEPSRKASESMHPLKRIGQPRDIARVIQMIIEPEGAWITGQVFGVDGGLSRVKSK